ncbi:SPOR domain-containing protein [Crocosphaera watsonii WH 8501]|nr:MULTISPECIES: hypothetical protein [Crocosphaera]MCH2246463.1 hypothetical protein [Crocosphaera sp.]CCQ50907.1 FIG00557876: hypothetical protein [Crocosphaera watsonii WH 8502]CCQ56453.1 hypothetical protein CWATWH0005_865 [Crocosphaera watsonii WH 0005]CCQ62605.1 tRNA (5-methylaminomethyl-2-thiouridylate)-methyltransferase [Crocosphaera watsonii WH 0401]CCQ69046.1 tRNA (5-methylaminomethyl-2-thiouridylate)-methyltransferase [Crocosphaera watsonii WH 0402]
MFISSDRLIIRTIEQMGRFPSYLKQSSTWFCFCLLTVGSTSVSLAQVTSNRELPPPPAPKMVTSESPVNQITPAEESSTPIKEYTFSAPQTIPTKPLTEDPAPSEIKTINPQPTQNPNFYRVEVTGKNHSLLSQVKTIEPMAFIRQSEGVIHAGVFQHSQQAEARVQELKNQGLPATVVPVYQQTRTSLSVEVKP